MNLKKAELWRIDACELWCWRRLLRVPWTARRSNQSILKEISPGCSFGRTDVEAETPILWPPEAKNWLIGKDPDAGKDWGQEEKETTKDEMVGWHHQLDGHEFEQALGVGDGTAVHGVARSWTWLSNELNSLRGVCPYIPRAHWVVGGLLMGRLCLVIGPYGVIIPSSHRGWGIVILSFFVLSFFIIIFQRNFSYIFVKEILVL